MANKSNLNPVLPTLEKPKKASVTQDFVFGDNEGKVINARKVINAKVDFALLTIGKPN